MNQLQNFEEQEIVVDVKKYHASMFHKLVQQGGSVKFPNSLFGIRVRGIGEMYVNIELFVIPQGKKYEGHITPIQPKKEIKKEKIEIEESEEIEM